MFKIIKSKGITLLEVLLSLSIIAIILVMATRYYTITRSAQQVNDASSMVETIRAASARWLMAHTDFTDISIQELINLNLLPKNFIANPWGGSMAVTAAAEDVTKFKITFNNIPFKSCLNLEARIAADTDECQIVAGNMANYVGTFSN